MARVQGSGVLELVVPDGWISEAHAELRRENSHWTVRDLGSKNSTLVDGERLQTADLPDQTLFQLGRTFFSFRSKLPVWGPPLTWKGRTCPGPKWAVRGHLVRRPKHFVGRQGAPVGN
jgi:pSer/pThr/pTyr-binding forkhead associated (FHA) protein